MMKTLFFWLAFIALAQAAQPGITFKPGEPQVFGPISVGKAHKYTDVLVPGWTDPNITLLITVENFVGGVWKKKFETRLRGRTPIENHPLSFTFDRGATQVRATATASGGSLTLSGISAGTK
jgi:hypothetical protein